MPHSFGWWWKVGAKQWWRLLQVESGAAAAMPGLCCLFLGTGHSNVLHGAHKTMTILDKSPKLSSFHFALESMDAFCLNVLLYLNNPFLIWHMDSFMMSRTYVSSLRVWIRCVHCHKIKFN